MADRLGIGEDYRKIPDVAKRRMYANPALPPIVSLDRTASADPEAKEAAEAIRKGLRETNLIIEWLNDARVPLHLYFSALTHLDGFLREFSMKNTTHTAATRCHRVVADVAEKATQAAGSALENVVISNLLPHQRFDQKVYGVRFGRIIKGQSKLRLDIQLFREPARRVQVQFEGIARPTYQCGGFLRPGVIDWIEWKPRDLGVTADDLDKPCPVLVQSHAIKNTQERLGMPPQISGSATVMMFHSLLKPNVVARQPDGSMLVECRGEFGRLGYFVVNFLGDKFLVNTFLFLTMKGTPEADRLYENLRISRHTVEMMGLDDLTAFIVSDLAHDKELADVLTECGCGHLLKLSDRMPFKVTALARQAKHLRRILGWAVDDSKSDAPSIEEIEDAADEFETYVSKAEGSPGLLGRIMRKVKTLAGDDT